MGKRKKNKTKKTESSPDIEVTEATAEQADGDKENVATSEPAESADERIKRLETEKKELFDQFLRLKAEFENYKKRTVRDMQDRVKFAEERLLRELLPVLDSFDRALEQYDPDGSESSVWDGMDRIRRQFHDVLARAGLEPVESVGAKFDPNMHEALFTVPTDEHEEHTVVNELERGYVLRGKVIRPTKVAVSVPKEAETEQNKEDNVNSEAPDTNGADQEKDVEQGGINNG